MKKTETSARLASGRLAGAIGIGANLLLFLGKLAVGVVSGSVSVTADAMNNLSDASSSVVTLLGFKLAEKPADEDHPYGHARFEYLAALAVAVLIVFIGFELAKASVSKMISPTEVTFDGLAVAVLVASMGVKLGLWFYYRRMGKKIDAEVLLATAADCRNDVIATGAVLVSGLLQRQLGWRLDGFAGLAVAAFILLSGIGLAKDTISPLLGEAATPELREQILDEIRATPKILGYHDLMVHDYGPGRRFASVHVEMDSREDPLSCHEIIDRLERECWESHGIQLVIHYDPVVTDDPRLQQQKELLAACLKQIDPRLSFHDLRVTEQPSSTDLIFDIVLPPDLTGQEQLLQQKLDQALAENSETPCRTVITFDLQ